jgi:hypothetical protein
MSNRKCAVELPENVAAVLLFLAVGFGSTGSVLAATSLEKRAAVTPKIRPATTAPAVSSTIFWGVDKNGTTTLSDRPEQALSKSGAQRAGQSASPTTLIQGPAPITSQTGSATFLPAADADSLARAQREQAYWRDQANQFRIRQRDRERDLEETRRLRFQEAQDRDPGFYSVPIYARSAEYFAQRNAPYVAGFSTPAVYTSSPGAAAAAGPASFIGSGFSSAGRR